MPSRELRILPACDPQAPAETEYDVDLRPPPAGKGHAAGVTLPGSARVTAGYIAGPDAANREEAMVVEGTPDEVAGVLARAGHRVFLLVDDGPDSHADEVAGVLARVGYPADDGPDSRADRDRATAAVVRARVAEIRTEATEPEHHRFELELQPGKAVELYGGAEWPQTAASALRAGLMQLMEPDEVRAALDAGPIVDEPGSEVTGNPRTRIGIGNTVVRAAIERLAVQEQATPAAVAASIVRTVLAVRSCEDPPQKVNR